MSEILARAKVNLHLEVLNRRSDGFHNIFSLMAHAGLADLLKLEEIDLKTGIGRVETVCRGIEGPFADSLINLPSDKSTITRAVEAFCETAALTGRVVYTVVKNIPAGGGLGGGSADAAAVINELHRVTGALNKEERQTAALKIGADVPFCLMNSGSALCEGVGELIEPLEAVINLPLLIINNGTQVNTGEAYRLLNRPAADDHTYRKSMNIDEKRVLIKQLLAAGDIERFSAVMKNDFEGPVFHADPDLRLLKQKVLDSGALTAIMSGSGSTIIGLYRTIPDAKNALAVLEKDVKTVILTGFC
jgi:4-diphosphocytidyl-2-C-methyl-D-erythritol kinase